MTELEALDTLIGGYLNEDWYLEYGDSWAAVERFVLWEPQYAPAIRAEVEALTTQCNTDREVENVLDRFGLGYAATTAGWPSYQAWLFAVADRIDELLHTMPAA